MTDPQISRETRSRARTAQRRWPLVSGLTALAVAGLAGGLIALRDFEVVPYAIDDAWRDELVENRHPVLDTVAFAFDWLGGGVVGFVIVPALLVLLLLIARRPWGAVYLTAAFAASGLVVQVIKNLVARPRPEDILVQADFGSFPSGHAANAAVLAAALGLLAHRWWAWGLGAVYTLAMMLSRNYLGAHWLTDTLGGLVVGAGAALVLWAPFARRLVAEADRQT